MNNKECAEIFIEAIRKFLNKPGNLDNFECYLSYNFDTWLKKYAYTPENLAAEMKQFAEMKI